VLLNYFTESWPPNSSVAEEKSTQFRGNIILDFLGSFLMLIYFNLLYPWCIFISSGVILWFAWSSYTSSVSPMSYS